MIMGLIAKAPRLQTSRIQWTAISSNSPILLKCKRACRWTYNAKATNCLVRQILRVLSCHNIMVQYKKTNVSTCTKLL